MFIQAPVKEFVKHVSTYVFSAHGRACVLSLRLGSRVLCPLRLQLACSGSLVRAKDDPGQKRRGTQPMLVTLAGQSGRRWRVRKTLRRDTARQESTNNAHRRSGHERGDHKVP